MTGKYDYMFDYGQSYMSYNTDNTYKKMHIEKMQNFISLITKIWNDHGRKETFTMSCGEWAYTFVNEAVLSTRYKNKSVQILLDNTIDRNVVFVDSISILLVERDVPYYAYTPFGSNIASTPKNKLESFINLCKRDIVHRAHLLCDFDYFMESDFDDAYAYFCSKGCIQAGMEQPSDAKICGDIFKNYKKIHGDDYGDYMRRAVHKTIKNFRGTVCLRKIKEICEDLDM
jgi:hypothetical protein